jgi:hypothetical protein
MFVKGGDGNYGDNYAINNNNNNNNNNNGARDNAIS